MCAIDFTVCIGDKSTLGKAYIAGTGNSIGVTVGVHQGYIVKYRDGWGYSPNSPHSIIYSHDVFIILDMFREKFPKLDIFKTDYKFCDYFFYYNPYRHRNRHT
ncbi:hypothetical protein Cpin_3915 [Chitinophaga pinensis DSM 2588]|uniref:Uncharacterized protein n=1 Tax=Chitinophaga pinensis (strain ATCC 43595 / DSM 2588 / LMG 13176 / NBRC 15968 / NCIMB 11800 / UQM 2034) TaxID=485918 RepID=A0A979G5W1_CHIPD|nr:hypothetical protein Cpin_3915 [Chitinophaga pinensis DSM 2588]